MKVPGLKQAAMSCLGEGIVKGSVLYMLLEEPGKAGFGDRTAGYREPELGIQVRE